MQTGGSQDRAADFRGILAVCLVAFDLGSEIFWDANGPIGIVVEDDKNRCACGHDFLLVDAVDCVFHIDAASAQSSTTRSDKNIVWVM